MSPMEIFLHVLLAQVNVPYKWGGKNPLEGFDCSGLVEWALRSVGLDPPGVRSSQMLHDWFQSRGSYVPTHLPGTLLFYSKTGKVTDIYHVAIQLNLFQVIEASGGDRTTLTFEDARARGACVKVRHISERKSEIVATIKPDFSRVGLY